MGKREGLSIDTALCLGALEPFSPVKKSHIGIQAILTQKEVAVQVEAMIDSGATGNFVDDRWAQKQGWRTEVIDKPVKVHINILT